MGTCTSSRKEPLRRRQDSLPSMRNLLTNDKGVNFRQKYTTDFKLLGIGGEGTVYEGKSLQTNDKVAIKYIMKNNPKFHEERLKVEISILRDLKHKSVLKMYDFFADDQRCIIVTELVLGGTLLKRISAKKGYTEKDALDVMTLLLDAVAYIHSMGIVHRDLKPENILLTSEKNNSDLKICDFGVATFCDADDITEHVGTILYIAPEVLNKKPYGKAVDVWALGCILFVLLTGTLPFHDSSRSRIVDKVKRGDYDRSPTKWEGVSGEAQDLIAKILVLDPSKRMTIRQMLNHPWIHVGEDQLSSRPLPSQQSRLMDTIDASESSHRLDKILNPNQEDLEEEIDPEDKVANIPHETPAAHAVVIAKN